MSELPSVTSSDIQMQFRHLLQEADLGDTIHDLVVEVCGRLIWTHQKACLQHYVLNGFEKKKEGGEGGTESEWLSTDFDSVMYSNFFLQILGH